MSEDLTPGEVRRSLERVERKMDQMVELDLRPLRHRIGGLEAGQKGFEAIIEKALLPRLDAIEEHQKKLDASLSGLLKLVLVAILGIVGNVVSQIILRGGA